MRESPLRGKTDNQPAWFVLARRGRFRRDSGQSRRSAPPDLHLVGTFRPAERLDHNGHAMTTGSQSLRHGQIVTVAQNRTRRSTVHDKLNVLARRDGNRAAQHQHRTGHFIFEPPARASAFPDIRLSAAPARAGQWLQIGGAEHGAALERIGDHRCGHRRNRRKIAIVLRQFVERRV